MLCKLLQMNLHGLLEISDYVALCFMHLNSVVLPVIPNVLTILHFMICLLQKFPRVRPLNSSLEACRHSRLSDHTNHCQSS